MKSITFIYKKKKKLLCKEGRKEEEREGGKEGTTEGGREEVERKWKITTVDLGSNPALRHQDSSMIQ
jgi:hypothetical protein